MKEENETTSLLSSSTAPHPTRTQSLRLPPPSSSLFSPRNSLTSSVRHSVRDIEEMERGAHRLVQEVGDSDSIHGLLSGVLPDDDTDEDWSVGSGYDDDHSEGGEDANGARRRVVTKDELEFLSGETSRRSSTQELEEGEQDDVLGRDLCRRSDSSSGKNSKNNRNSKSNKKGRLADRIGKQLLDASTAEMEQRILSKSLRLDRRDVDSFHLHDNDEDEEDDEKDDDDDELQQPPQRVLARVHESTRALRATTMLNSSQRGSRAALLEMMKMGQQQEEGYPEKEGEKKLLAPTSKQIGRMLALIGLVMMVLYVLLSFATRLVGPPRLPLGEYKIVEAQVGSAFFQYYEFYAGKDSVGSNGYNMYVSREVAEKEQIVKVVTEPVDERSMVEVYEDGDVREEVDWLKEDLAFLEQLKRKKETNLEAETEENSKSDDDKDSSSNSTVSSTSTSPSKLDKHSQNPTTTATKKKNAYRRNLQSNNTNPPKLEAFNPDVPTNITNDNSSDNDPTETFVILSSSPTNEGPRNSIRLEGKRRFNRGLFIIDLRHMPAGCGTWPAFWLTDEANWPVNGEIDIVEGVNYQDTAKTALHTTRTCSMDDVPEGSKTGTWDTAVGIPDKKTGIPDMTFRFAQDCFVYDPHQWINQGCVATDLKLEGRSLGVPLNDNGGGVYALEWDPINTHIRTWVFSPHGRVPRNLRDALRTATNIDETTRVAPDTTQWGLPYGHFPIGDGTNCPSEHFRNMRLVINLAFCGSVSGTRYFMDCPKQFKQFKTCEQWVDSDPDELKEAYWKIRGVYVYEREWQKKWS